PALAANNFNGISHINRLYYTLFKPTATPKWDGNVKPYKLNDNYELVDAADPARPVVGANGAFLEASRSFWSDEDDGASIIIGGANDRLPAPNNRKLYTYTGGYDDITGLTPDGESKISDDENALNTDNDELTAGMLGLSKSDYDDDADKLSDEFTRVLDTIRSAGLGAPLHSQPALVTYGGDDAENADLTLFVATNDGFLHAFDASPDKEGTEEGGKELFAFIPKELLPKLPELASQTGSIVYGLDGDVSVWVKENAEDTDVTINSADGDHVYVYVGMRRGGNNYYALDVTDRTEPTLKWVIRGGAGGTPGFEELGQTWSRPTLTSIKDGEETKNVLIFGGGYDTAQDGNPLSNDEDTIGRAIFIVDADKGTLLWSAGPTNSDANLTLADMTHSIPSDIRLMDSNHDGYTDRLYVGDMRGQIFRIDLDTTLNDSKGVLLARLGGNIEADNRRFYYPPDVVLTQRRGTAPYISINIGSGYRAHPLNPLTTDGEDDERVNDRFYSLRDPYVTEPIPVNGTFTLITDGDGSNLFDATDSLVTSDNDISALAASTGWYITLGAGSGEKVLAPAVTINGEIFFTTYTPPERAEASGCAPPPGASRLYRVSLFDATPTRNETEVDDESPTTPTPDDRYESIRRPGISSGPTVMFRKNSAGKVELTLCVGTECKKPPETNQIQRTFWQDGM
ncbi:MAG: hypothetical protein GXP18_05445, partial [Gammaproteobacteria bacterium]|nr:hypothetical protein [Gammaproteobacteria bacterium]